MIKDHLSIDTFNMKFDLTKSLGNPVTPKNPRPVQVSFQLYADREEVRGTAFSHTESLESKIVELGSSFHKIGAMLANDFIHVR